MPKGKSFRAAEKHFQEKEVRYQKQIQHYKQTILQMNEIQTGLVLEKQKLLDENTQLHEWIERLLAYTELSIDDIKTICEQDKKRGEAFTGFMKIVNVKGMNRYKITVSTDSYSNFRRKQENILGKIKSRVLSLADKYIEFIFEPFIRELNPLSVLFSSLAGCLFVGWLYTGSVKWGVFSFVYFTFVVTGIFSYLILWMFGNKQG